MKPTAPPTTDELKAAWRRSGAWRFGRSFLESISIRTVRIALTQAALAHRARLQTPAQPSLF